MMPKDRNALMHDIQVYGFALVEVNLYLDTHPGDQAAIACYNKYNRLLEEAYIAYESQYGPLTIHGGTDNDCWSWVKGPWPWEYSANTPR
ncbi:MAG: spore coat protein CotJB [Clostridiales bacterium]|jgi:spore coat protein JB|nr:spore coat protein CotJB [Clostridiales bacterium]